ncbi:MAG: signal peptidase I [Ruminococcus sp. CAG:9-related_41_34]|nr:MAG: signal peptidase I [Ruminococcus sp. CAG:9-related_41_34]
MMRAEKDQTCSQTIRKRRYSTEIKEGYIRLFWRIVLIVAVGWLLFTQVEMFPAVDAGDLLIGFRMEQNFAKNDVVVYEAGGKTHVGRILGCETDVITMDDTGTLLVNGTAQTGEIAFPTYAKEGITYPYTVPEGSVFILGDYRTQAKDSREFGPISTEDVKAKVITILRRREL